MTDAPIASPTYVLETKDLKAFYWAVRWRMRDHVFTFVSCGLLMIGVTSLAYLVVRQAFRFAEMEGVFNSYEQGFVFASLFVGALYLMLAGLTFGGTQDPKFTASKRTLTISTSGIETTADNSKYAAPWSEIERIALTPKHIFFFPTRTTAFIVPTRIFVSAQDAKMFGEKAIAWLRASRV